VVIKHFRSLDKFLKNIPEDG